MLFVIILRNDLGGEALEEVVGDFFFFAFALMWEFEHQTEKHSWNMR